MLFPLPPWRCTCLWHYNKVEALVMRALSVGLIRGSIDGVEQRLNVTWLQPRVLDRGQIEALSKRFASWRTTVKEAAELVNHNAADVFA
jgi:26S proteasome regulatory subunit N9